MRRHSGIVALVVMSSLAACSRTERVQDTTATRGATAAGDSIVASGEPFVIHTKKSQVNLGFANDTVYMALSDSLRARARSEMDTSGSEDSSGFGRVLSSVIKKTVNRALGARVAYAVSELDGARYEDGTIRFDYRNKHRFSFESVKTDNRDALSDFDPADAQRFVAVVNAAIRAQRSGQ
ncbi:MAG TPA: hypothetical protein VGT98_03545 [Candidatus Elarobacter sp.]|nr:hypothetical protein [Candidatus Elarobacter sp.]